MLDEKQRACNGTPQLIYEVVLLLTRPSPAPCCHVDLNGRSPAVRHLPWTSPARPPCSQSPENSVLRRRPGHVEDGAKITFRRRKLHQAIREEVGRITDESLTVSPDHSAMAGNTLLPTVDRRPDKGSS